MICLALLLCGFTSNKGGVSDVEAVNVNYMTDKPPKGKVLLTMYESKSNTKYNGFVTSDGTSSEIEVKVTADPVKNMTFFGENWYNCHALVNITTECKEKLGRGQLRVELTSKAKGCQKNENTNKKETKKILGVIVTAIGYAIILSKVTGRREKVD